MNDWIKQTKRGEGTKGKRERRGRRKEVIRQAYKEMNVSDPMLSALVAETRVDSGS